MLNLDNVIFATFEEAESFVKAFAKLNGFAVRLSHTKKIKIGEWRKVWIGYIHCGCYKKKGNSVRIVSTFKTSCQWLASVERVLQ